MKNLILEGRYVVVEATGCWEWIKAIDRFGYGRLRIDGKNKLAHRISYIIHKGAIPDGLVLDHLCQVKTCINPEHLEAVTQAVNINRNRYRKYPQCVVEEIKLRVVSGELQKSIAKELGMSRSNVSMIINHKTRSVLLEV